jgi:hypothetical protein
VCEALAVSERWACRVLGQVRHTQRYAPILSDEETALVTNVVSYKIFGQRTKRNFYVK